MNKYISLLAALLLVSFLGFAQDPVESIGFSYSDMIVTDSHNVFTFQRGSTYVTAWDVNSGNSKSISLPPIENGSEILIRYANSIPDGYIVTANYVKTKKNDPKGKTLSAIFFFDNNGQYKEMLEFADREFLALSSWDNQNLVVAWDKIVFRENKRFVINDLTIIDRKGHFVANLEEQKNYDLKEYYKEKKPSLLLHRIYWQGDTLVYVDPTAGEVSFFDKNKVEMKRVKAKPEAIPGDGKKCMSGYLKIPGKEIVLLISVQNNRGHWYWSDLSNPDINTPMNNVVSIHAIGNRFYAAIPLPDSDSVYLQKITEENWPNLLQ